MKKTGILLSAVLILLFAGALYLLYAQEKFTSDNPDHPALARKLDALAASVERSNMAVSAKLDQVIANQERIFKELDVIRIRASRNR